MPPTTGENMSQNLWLMLSALMVFLMQAGFLCLESGRTRSKNSINVAAKNVTDFILSCSIFWLIGFSLMFGSSVKGLFGTDLFAYGDNQSAYNITFFIFQMMFCSTAATLTSGAIAERATFIGYILITIILSTFIYPVVGHWAWAGAFTAGNDGWLQTFGFVDFAGATVVHSVGGWVALAAVIIIGPRFGRYSSNKPMPQGSNLPVAALGTLLIWFGWFGFNGGSTLALTDTVPLILLNTCLAALWGGLTATAIMFYQQRYIDVASMLNGIIAGLVGITASCHAVSPMSAAIIGGISGIILIYGTHLLNALKIDDALGVVPSHLLAGIWGTLAVGFFGSTELLDTGLTRPEQIRAQLTGIAVIGAYSFLLSYALMKLINKFVDLRVTEEDELRGLNIAEHRASTELIDLLSAMESHQSRGDYTTTVSEEPFTEVGQIAKKYNQVITQVSRQIQEKDNALDQFQTSESRKSAILDSSMDCIITINKEGAILEFNPAAERTFGCLNRHVRGKNFIDLFSIPAEKEKMTFSLNNKFAESHGVVLNRRNAITLQRAAGQPFPAEVTITSTRADSIFKTEYTLHIRDVTRQLKMQKRLQFLAYSDPLTNLANRTFLLEALRKVIRDSVLRQVKVALFFMDLDKFKKINDTLGHKAGDELLCEVANRLIEISRGSDVVARWGGDEFILMMAGDFDEARVQEKAETILNSMRKPLNIGGKNFSLPTSIGIVINDKANVEAEQLIQNADIAMYSAKENGRDKYQFFTPDIAYHAARTFQYEQEMKQALASDEFVLSYQPKVYLEKNNVIGLEALIRWHHPIEGNIPPSTFIPIAEESDLIVNIGEYVIKKTLEQLRTWIDEQINIVPVSVNISSKHLISDELVPFIKQQLSFHEIDGSYLEIEVTEGVLLSDINRCIEVMAELKSININISIDDFGTGYSSLNYLKRLPIDVLKIDQSFVKECDVKEEDQQICSTIVSLGKGLGLGLVAEGVETEAQRQALISFGCEVFQGYFFHKPMPPQSVSNWLKSKQALTT